MRIKLSAKIEIEEGNEIEIGFILHKASGNNYNVHLDNHNSFDFRKFNEKFTNLPKSIGCYFSSPVATIASYEEFATAPKIREGIKIRQSSAYFRNRLFNLSNRDEFIDFKNDLSKILYNEIDQIEFRITGNRSNDININAEVEIKNSGLRNISLLGSGTIQIIEILLHLFESPKQLNIILLDEPDSHIHRDIQKRLLKYLSGSNVQVFLTTHNESLIRSANPKDLFFIDGSVSNINPSEIKAIGQDKLPGRKIGIEKSHHSKLISLIGSESSLDILNALEADKILFVEGVDDSEYIQKLKQLNRITKDCVFWSFGGLDKLISKIIHYKEFFQSLGCNQSIWEKCSIIIDADFLTSAQKNKLKEALNQKLGINIFIWDSYTIESTVLTDLAKTEVIINRIILKQNILKTPQEISQSINTSFETLKNKKIYDLNESNILGTRIAGQLEARISNLDSNLGISRNKVFETITIPHLFNNYRLYANPLLNSNSVSHISDKGDIESFFENIFNELGIIKDSEFENNFSFILDNTETADLNQEWLNLMNFINT